MGFSRDEDELSNRKALRDSIELAIKELDNEEYPVVRERLQYILDEIL